MTRLQFWLIPLVGLALFLLTGALNRKPTDSEPAPLTEVGPLPAGKDADQLLDQAIQATLPQAVPWQRMQIWQRFLTDSGSRVVQGRYLTGPNCRLRLELEVQVGKTRAEVQLIADGQRLWQRQRSGSAAAVVTQSELPLVPRERAQDGAFLAWRTRHLHAQSFGVATLLTLIRAGGQGWQGKMGKWNGLEVVHLSASWPDALENQEPEAGTDGLQPPPRAKQVCILLDAQSLWPLRIEWWGEKNGNEKLPVMEMEFRAPVLNQPMTAAECGREFTFLPE